MTDTPAPTYRSRIDPPADTVEVRESDELDTDDDMMAVRMPAASTGEVRNEGDDPLTTDELRGMAQQVDDLTRGVFPEHGKGNFVSAGQYSQFEKRGYWSDAEVVDNLSDDGEDMLMATARMPDPETLPSATGDYREALAILKEQAKRGIPISASIGWREDESAPGGNDLMEMSIVGIGADPDDLIAHVRDAVASMRDTAPDTERPLGPPGDRDRFESFDECVTTLSQDDDLSEADAERICGAWEQASKDERASRVTDTVNGEEIDLTPPEAVVNAAEAAREAKEEYSDDIGDCGTGDGEESARKIIDGDLTADYVADDIAPYLTSHADDVAGITAPPTDWDRETWTDGCGPVQYALWGGTATGTGRDWAQRVANEVADANDEDDMPYPNRNIDDPEFSEGDAVSWDWQGDTVHGRVADVGEQFTVGGNTITGEEGEAVYLIHEWDDEVEAFRRENVAKPESSLSESGMDLPPASEENFQSMTDDDTADNGGTTEPDGDSAETTRAPEDIGEDDVAEFVAEAYDGVDAADVMEAMNDAGAEYSGLAMETLGWFVGDILDVSAGEAQDLIEEMTEGDAKPDDDQGDDMGGEDEDDMDEQAADTDALAERVAELEDALEAVRSGEADIETPQDGPDADNGDTTTTDRATAGPNWRR